MIKLFRVALLVVPLCLSACGDGWEMIRTDKYVPYGNTRTAGTGVAYVRAKLLPEKDLNLTPVVAPVAPEKVFHDAQKK